MPSAAPSAGEARPFAVSLGDDRYPSPLAGISSPPATLHVLGALPPAGSVAVVGTRHPTPRGRRVAEAVARSAVEAGLAVVSGLAAGIDTVAHRAALDAGGVTFAVLGSGLDRPTPSSNRRLAAEIVERGGGLLAEVPLGTATSARHLVARDRIQSGLSVAVVICQSELGGGALHTARFAVAEGRLLVVVRPDDREADERAWSGNRVLADPGGCDPAVLSATGKAAALVRERRPVADVVLERREGLAAVWAAVAERLGTIAARRGLGRRGGGQSK